MAQILYSFLTASSLLVATFILANSLCNAISSSALFSYPTSPTLAPLKEGSLADIHGGMIRIPKKLE
jgi:hypothetical protein